MIALTTAAYFTLSFLVAFVCGYGVVRFLLPMEYQEYRFGISAPIGYCVCSWFMFVISGTFGVTVERMTWIAFVCLSALSLAALFYAPARERWGDVVRGAGSVFLLSATMLVVILWPLFYVGAETYLGAVNPDYFSSLQDNGYLKNHSTVDRTREYDTYVPVSYGAGALLPSARFSSSTFGILLETLLGLPGRTALTLAIAVFLYCLPFSVYFMARVAFCQPKAVARLSAVLMGLSGCIAMSYLYFYVGQNSALGIAPLLLTVLFILVTRPSVRILSLAALLVVSVFLMYGAMLFYVGAPVGALALYLLLRRELSFLHGLGIGAGLLLVLVVVNAGMLSFLSVSFRGWMHLITASLQGQYFLDFLTELFFPMFFGLLTYTVDNAWLSFLLGLAARPVALALSLLIALALLLAVLDWARHAPDRQSKALGLASLLIYGVVWLRYTFYLEYGYALFKMAAWLQFLLMPLAAYGLVRLWTLARKSSLGLRRAVARGGFAAAVLIFAGGNLISSIDYGVKGLGGDPDRGVIVNNYQMSGNYDYFELEPNIRRLVKRGESIGLACTDSIQNYWISYYLSDFKLSFLAHNLFPGDDENLPDVITRRAVDYYGNVTPDGNPYFHGATDTYYLTVDDSHLNSDILSQQLSPPVWRNETFLLVRAVDAPGFLVTGRGYYRIETRSRPRQYWWPRKMRWVAQGGELYMFRSARPGQAHRLSFAGVVGYGANNGRRTIELWHNERKFDEVVINGNGRVLSAPFYPSGEVDRLVFRIRESVQQMPRRFRLWNKTIPAEYRRLNLAVWDIRVYGPQDSPPVTTLDAPLTGDALFTQNLSFSGLDMNGWVREEMTMSLVRTPGSSSLTVSASIPARQEFRWPYQIALDVNGVTKLFSVDKPGSLAMTVPLPLAVQPETVDIRLRPAQAVSPGGYMQQFRPQVESVRLEAITFRSYRMYTDLSPPLKDLNPNGLEPDGWMLHEAKFTVDGHKSIKIVELNVEFPGWSKAKQCSVSVLLNGRPAQSHTLKPGYHTLRIPLANPRQNTEITVNADRSFLIPAPDTRTGSLRIRSARIGWD